MLKFLLIILILGVGFISCNSDISPLIGTNNQLTRLEQQLAQKIMLDLRYYCPNMKPVTEKKCKTPLTQLPQEIAQLITDSSLGSVILFAENIKNTQQTVQLTSDLQNAALKSKLAQPLIISVDQEGGRVVRIPRAISTSFSGNMAIGATYQKHGDTFAKQVGEVIGTELNALGINTDHAPDVDVNINPENPVINVRSFSANAHTVATLGIAMLEGIQSKGVVATLKHFPGHGDTNTDSHTGLPIVHHSLTTVRNVDLLPFKQAIEHANVQMIMTAHIQYPALDNTTVMNKFGQSMIKPATLSKKILTDLLRNEMGYNGIIITDALDMAGIASFFTPIEAVLHTFEAGADIAMMPMKIRKPDDIKQFKVFLQYLAKRIKEEQSVHNKIQQSLARIFKLKAQFPTDLLTTINIEAKVLKAKKSLANKQHKAVESALAENAIVKLKQEDHFFEEIKTAKRVHIIFPKKAQSQAMTQYLQAASKQKKLLWQITSSYLNNAKNTKLNEKSLFFEDVFKKIEQSDLIVIASDSQNSAVVNGGVEDLKYSQFTNTLIQPAQHKYSSTAQSLSLLKYAKSQHKTTVFITLRLPTNIDMYKPFSDQALASFSGQAYIDKNTHKAVSPALKALAAVIVGDKSTSGELPTALSNNLFLKSK